jgi:hypothetical protein
MTSISNQFRSEIEAYLHETGTSPTAFGIKAMSDPTFVFEVRAGRSPSARTIDRVREFMNRETAA